MINNHTQQQKNKILYFFLKYFSPNFRTGFCSVAVYAEELKFKHVCVTLLDYTLKKSKKFDIYIRIPVMENYVTVLINIAVLYYVLREDHLICYPQREMSASPTGVRRRF
jgi:hypothetical protein